ncbi:hypothetical protein P7K49_018580 [Saguinus oedipus]|uniref:Uncharacterized protein n=1 Tax=Saguinus oedipus TaxID=9490 RepID=A0ABQ9V700_SAGOE|nr:hypothetical protein P7K49_018580 [Saguinus oedipus]
MSGFDGLASAGGRGDAELETLPQSSFCWQITDLILLLTQAEQSRTMQGQDFEAINLLLDSPQNLTSIRSAQEESSPIIASWTLYFLKDDHPHQKPPIGNRKGGLPGGVDYSIA